MPYADLHSALKTEIIGTSGGQGVSYKLVKLQSSKIDISYSLHVTPNSYTFSGLQTTDLLGYLGFKSGPCAFSENGKCFAIEVKPEFPIEDFAKAFGEAYTRLNEASKKLEHCGYPLDQPEGWGFFNGRGPLGRSYVRAFNTSGDGHTSPKLQVMKKSEDGNFFFMMSWIEGGDNKGWTFHYRPKHLPLSSELEASFNFLRLKTFNECPLFDFESCYWRFFNFESRDDDFFGSNAEYVHRYFDNHAQYFSLGIENLLAVHKIIHPFSFTFLQIPTEIYTPPVKPVIPSIKSRTTTSPPKAVLNFDVALSFAGTERKYAEQLANLVRAAGHSVFYDDFYPDQLWGKDLVVLFDNIYRKQSRYCVIFISNEYCERIWTNHERRSAQARALEEKGKEYILPIKVDDLELPGLQPTIGYISISEHNIDDIAKILIAKLKS